MPYMTRRTKVTVGAVLEEKLAEARGAKRMAAEQDSFGRSIWKGFATKRAIFTEWHLLDPLQQVKKSNKNNSPPVSRSLSRCEKRTRPHALLIIHLRVSV
jgi:hypothetical protein